MKTPIRCVGAGLLGRRLLLLVAALSLPACGPALAALQVSPYPVETGSNTAYLNTSVSGLDSDFPASVWFEWGLTSSYGNGTDARSLPESGEIFPPGYWTFLNNEWDLDNLIPATTYHYRVVVTNRVQTVVSEDRMFTTQGVWGLVQPPYSPLTQVGRGTGWVAAGDVNGDGHPDLVCNNRVDNTLDVLLATTGGGFTNAAPSPIPVGQEPMWVALADVNRDGKLDAISTDRTGHTVTVLLGDGTGAFSRAPGSPFSAGTGPWGLAVGDFNADGNVDIVTANYGGNGLTVLLGDGNGGFTKGPTAVMPVPGACLAVAAGDLNADGKLDVVASMVNNGLAVLVGDGRGGFAPGPQPRLALPSPSGNPTAFSVALADLNGDGRSDIAATCTYDSQASAWLNVGNGHFQSAPGSPFATGAYPRWIGAADLNRDGKLDLITANEGGSISLLLGDGGGGFGMDSQSFPAGQHSNGLAVEDLDGDGTLDLVCANGGLNQTGAGSLTVYLNPVSLPRFGVATGPPSWLSPDRERLTGTVTNLVRPVSAWFEWGLTDQYGQTTPPIQLPAGYGSLPVVADLHGLKPGMAYHYRLVAFDGTDHYRGADSTFGFGPFVWTSDGTAVTIQSHDGTGGALSIPDAFGGLPVRYIAAAAFAGATNLVTVTIPGSVVEIGDSAFGGCSNLRSVYFRGLPPALGVDVFVDYYTGGGGGWWGGWWSFPVFVPATLYHLPGIPGWEAFASSSPVPVAVWQPRINPGVSRLDRSSGAFVLGIDWARGNTVVVDATTNLVTGPWVALSTNILDLDTLVVTDPGATNHSSRSYRLRLP